MDDPDVRLLAALLAKADGDDATARRVLAGTPAGDSGGDAAPKV